jgi:hypothetical protein
VGHVVRMKETRSALKLLFRKFQLYRPRGRPWRRREDDIEMNIRGTRRDKVNVFQFALNRI